MTHNKVRLSLDMIKLPFWLRYQEFNGDKISWDTREGTIQFAIVTKFSINGKWFSNYAIISPTHVEEARFPHELVKFYVFESIDRIKTEIAKFGLVFDGE